MGVDPFDYEAGSIRGCWPYRFFVSTGLEASFTMKVEAEVGNMGPTPASQGSFQNRQTILNFILQQTQMLLYPWLQHTTPLVRKQPC